MYEVEIETPKGNIKFNIESLKDLTKYLLKYPDYTGVRATRVPDKVKKLERGIENESNRCNKQ